GAETRNRSTRAITDSCKRDSNRLQNADDRYGSHGESNDAAAQSERQSRNFPKRLVGFRVPRPAADYRKSNYPDALADCGRAFCDVPDSDSAGRKCCSAATSNARLCSGCLYTDFYENKNGITGQ